MADMNDDGEMTKKTIRFRNYQPNDKTLANKVIGAQITTFEEQQQLGSNKSALDLLKSELSSLEEETGGAGNINIMPKKANWDLKHTIEQKLERLKRLTHRSIVKILREKIREEDDNDSGNNN